MLGAADGQRVPAVPVVEFERAHAAPKGVVTSVADRNANEGCRAISDGMARVPALAPNVPRTK